MKIVIACGSGVATSTMIAAKVEDLLKRNKLKAQIVQVSLNEVKGHLKDATVIVTAMKRLEVDSDVPIVVALPYITGIGGEAIDAQIEAILLANKDK